MAIEYFEQVDIGDDLPTLEKHPTLEQVKGFCEVWTGRTSSSRFTDAETATKEGFSGPIVPGIMSMAMLSQLLTDWSPNLSIVTLDTVFRQPVVQDHLYRLGGIVTDKKEEDGQNILECDVYIERVSDGNRHVNGTAVVTLPARG